MIVSPCVRVDGGGGFFDAALAFKLQKGFILETVRGPFLPHVHLTCSILVGMPLVILIKILLFFCSFECVFARFLCLLLPSFLFFFFGFCSVLGEAGLSFVRIKAEYLLSRFKEFSFPRLGYSL